MTTCICGKEEIEEGHVLNALLYKNDKPIFICSDCPPQPCFNCKELGSIENPCSCTVKLENLALADIKAIFADGGLSVGKELSDDSGY